MFNDFFIVFLTQYKFNALENAKLHFLLFSFLVISFLLK